jgi:hypothetical protein
LTSKQKPYKFPTLNVFKENCGNHTIPTKNSNPQTIPHFLKNSKKATKIQQSNTRSRQLKETLFFNPHFHLKA